MDTEDGARTPGTLSLCAVAASMILCLVFYRVRMRQCEAVLQDMSRVLEDVRRAADALQTRRSVLKAAAVTAEKALVEYNTFLSMLHQLREGDGSGAELPILRHQIELETMRAQVSMVQGCLLAMSQEVLRLGAPPSPSPSPAPSAAAAAAAGESSKQEDIFTSVHRQRKSYAHMSEELLSLLDKNSSENVRSVRW